MKRISFMAVLGILVGLVPAVSASDARTSAEVGSSRGGTDHAAATADYDGRVGIARTNAKTGKINLARGLALGLDEDGVSFSLSQALGGKRASLASNLNVSLNRDGDHSVSFGSTVSRGSQHHTARVEGGASADRRRTRATAAARGDADRRGRVDARASARNFERERHEPRRRPLVYRDRDHDRDHRRVLPYRERIEHRPIVQRYRERPLDRDYRLVGGGRDRDYRSERSVKVVRKVTRMVID
jgi:hypothetical protein